MRMHITFTYVSFDFNKIKKLKKNLEYFLD